MRSLKQPMAITGRVTVMGYLGFQQVRLKGSALDNDP
jgi:predicted RNA binding protein YcfA (HicA-like mRNA interferase family)